MPTTNSRDLKATSYQLRTLLSRTLRSNSEDARVNIRRLLSFVNDTPMLRAEIQRAPEPAADVMQFWQATRNAGEHLQFPDDQLEELGLLHALLTEFSKPSEEDFWHLCYRYASVHDIKESIREVLHDVCGRYGDYLRSVIELALVNSDDPAYDSRNIEIHMSGGNNQLNVAQDQARIHAALTTGPEATEIVRLAQDLATMAATQTSEAAVELEEVASAIAEAVQQPKPSRFTLRAAKEKLELLANGVTAISTLAPYAYRLAALVGDWTDKIPR